MTARGVVAALAAAALVTFLSASAARAAAPISAHGTRPPAALGARTSTAPAIRRTCHGPTPVFDTPGGIVIGILARGDQVRVLVHAAGYAQWVLVDGPIGIRGWVRERALC
jgi:hypothetical protein